MRTIYRLMDVEVFNLDDPAHAVLWDAARRYAQVGAIADPATPFPESTFWRGGILGIFLLTTGKRLVILLLRE
ncbi:MAG: hypothetical protein A2V67_03525 [Deltaproteobacteria bacterium RBG_13_61_14]|nr:MAG: hypothetical protein A2V67_03525 [Deltaproteobacteria bacterium RBG_13_61_14]